MQASKSTIMSLVGVNYAQFKVPVYQRTYDWKTKHCEKLVKDIFDAMSHGKEHFTGSIVYLNETSFSNQKVSLIIDGQQRVTTAIIILKALANLSKKHNHLKMKEQIEDKYLFADTSDFKKVPKLIPTEEDEEQYELFIKDKFQEMDHEAGFYQNYNIIYSMLDSRLKSTEDLSLFYQTLINKMTIVELVLDNGVDDPQEIFESINSTGLELSQADLIRNFLLMSASEQDHLYKSYWKPLFKLLGQENIEDFMFNYLLYKTQRKLRYDEIYNVFIDSFKVSHQTREEVMSELLSIGIIYNAFINESSLFDESVIKLLHSFKYLEQTTIYPFLFKVFMDYQEELIDQEELLKVLRFFLNYHLKRMVVGSSSNSLRNLYISLYNRVFKLPTNKERYYDSIATFMSEIKTRDEVPSDGQFIKNLQTMEIYKQRKLIKFLLAGLENYQFSEKLLTEKLSVEHIMPQTLQPNWVKMLGPDYEKVHDEYVHTLGNLSITGYNSVMSNKSFEEKKVTLLEKSKAVFLNKDVIDKSSWSKDEIKARGKRLAEAILEMYRIPKYSTRGLRFENVEEHDINYEYEEIKGTSLYSFKFIEMDFEIKMDTYRGMLVRVIEILDNIDSRMMDDIAENIFSPWDDGNKDKLVNDSKIDKDQYHTKIRDNLYLSGGFSAAECIESIKRLMKHYNVDQGLFLFYTKIV